jgi:hypothetical protein
VLQSGVNWLRDHVGRTQQERFMGNTRRHLQERAILEFGKSMEQFAQEGMPLAI